MFSKNGKNIRQAKLFAAIREYWAPCRNDGAIEILARKNYPEVFLRNTVSNFHPLKHLLIIGFLFKDWGEFITQAESDNLAPIQNQARNLIITPNTSIDEQTILSSLYEGKSLREIAKRVACTVSTVKKVAIQNNVKIDCRPQKIFGEEQAQIIQLLKQGKPTNYIARKFKFSISAVEKILSQCPKIVEVRKKIRFKRKRDAQRHKLLARVSGGSSLTRNQIKLAIPSVYLWLFKYDKDWLYNNLPKPIDRKERYKVRV